MSEIRIENVTVRDVKIPHWMSRQPNVDHLVPPVVINIGNPIVNIPGCVKMHRDNQYHNNGLPIDRNLVENDPDQIMTLCDAEVPSYDAMNYEPEQLILTTEAPVPNVRPPEVEAPEVPSTGDLKVEKDPDCPGPGNLRVGDTTQSGEERVIGHQLIQDPGNPTKKICETLYEPTTTLQKYLPTVNQATSVTALAVVATAGAAATPLLIRIIRPVIKRLWATLQKKLGKGEKKEELTSDKILKKNGMKKLRITD